MAKPLILITGANQGIGFAAAQILAKAGKHHVVVSCRDAAKAQAAVDRLRAEAAAETELTALVMDVCDDASIAAAAKTVQERFGRLDILVNNAGISASPDPSAGLRANFRAVFETNVFGLAVVTEAFLPLLRASTYHDRRIVNVTSGLGQLGVVYHPTSEYNAKAFALSVYRSSKTAVNMLTAVDAVVLADEGILAVAAAPGYCRTGFTGGQGVKEASEGAMNLVRAATEGDPRELVGTVVADEYRVEQVGW